MLSVGLEYDIKPEVVTAATEKYARLFEREGAEEAKLIMQANIRIVPKSAPISPPGGWPVSRTGWLNKSIDVLDTGAGFVVGPKYRKPDSNILLRGASTIAQLINDGGVVVYRGGFGGGGLASRSGAPELKVTDSRGKPLYITRNGGVRNHNGYYLPGWAAEAVKRKYAKDWKRQISRMVHSRGSAGGSATVAVRFRPRPYIELTTDLIVDRLPAIAASIPFE